VIDLEYAKWLARVAHHGQVDKSSKPYYEHVWRVGDRLKETGHDDEVVAAGYLHDVLEAEWCGPEFLDEAFGGRVADLVFMLTRGTDQWYMDYIKSLCEDKDAVAIKIADILDNLRPGGTSSLLSVERDRYTRALNVLYDALHGDGSPVVHKITIPTASDMADTTLGPWYYNESVDLGDWMPCIGTREDSGQGDIYAYSGQRYLVCAFHPSFNVSKADAQLMASAPMLVAEISRLKQLLSVEQRTSNNLRESLASVERQLVIAVGESVKNDMG